MAIRFHPDKNFGDVNAGKAFGKISVAYNNIFKMFEIDDERR
jgi:DnaJ-class molecular chaperone